MRVLVSEKLSPHRFKTPEGYLICTDAILARTGKQTYRRREVFGDMSDKGEEEIEINRDEKEVFNPVTLASFENKPLTIEHPNEDVNPENHHDYAVGFTRDIKRGRIDGNDVMLGTIVVTDAEAIKDIESGELVELSCGYDCDVVDEANPQQRNIRGNHVALCERGRAGIARIIDSMKDDKMSELRSILRRLSKMYSNDPGIEFVLKELTNAGYDVSIDSIGGWYENRNVPGEYVKDYRLDVNIDGQIHHLLVMLYADEDTWKVKEINAYTNDAVNNEVKDMDYSKESKQGYKVLEMYRDGGRLHAILKRANDYVVALGYDTSDGTWAQGRYVDKYENALATLREEKPAAKKIQDCAIQDDELSQVSNAVEKLARNGYMTDEIIRIIKSKYGQFSAEELKEAVDMGMKKAGVKAFAISVSEFDSIQRANDDLEQSSSKEALKKNIATEIKAGKDPKQAAVIAYSVQRANDSIDDILNKIRTTQIKEGEQLTFEAEGYLIDIQSVGADRLEQRSDKRWASPRSSSHAWIRVWKDNQKVFDESGPINVARDRLIQFMKTRVNDSLKTFKVKYTKDSKTYIQKVKAKSITDAINKVKDAMAVPFDTVDEARAAMREIEPLYQRAYQNTMQRFTIDTWRNGYVVYWERRISDSTALQRLVGNKYVVTSDGVYKAK